MSKKLARNALCWCGSGKKHKKCHLGREEETAPSLQEILQGSKKALFSKRHCLHPQASDTSCNGGIIRAHTVQKNGGLSRIAVGGHVMSIKSDLARVIKNNGKIIPDKLGINNASTFTGFCNFHDTKTFSQIETTPLVFSLEQCFLLSYRALCIALYTKEAQRDSNNFTKTLDRGTSLVQQMHIQRLTSFVRAGIEYALQDIRLIKDRYDKILLNNDFTPVKYLVVEFDRTPDLLCSGMYSPEVDFKGCQLQDLSNTEMRASSTSFSIVCAGKGGAALLAWLDDDSDACYRFARSLCTIDDTRKPNVIAQFAFTCFENVHFSPIWWDNLHPVQKKLVYHMIMAGVDFNASQVLSDRELDLVDWQVTKIHHNL